MKRARILVGSATILVALTGILPAQSVEVPTAVAGVILSVQPELPNSCGVIATEAVLRMQRAGCSWARVLHITLVDPFRAPGNFGHYLAVWQPQRGAQLMVYDASFLNCSAETGLHVRDAGAIARALGALPDFAYVRIVEAHFVE